jgi:membrane AbrB-like protein
MAACLVMALLRAPLYGLGQVAAGARTALGVAVGASITPAIVAQLPSMAVTLTLVPIYIVVIGVIGVPYFRKLCGYDPATAWYAAMPGGLQDMVQFGKEAGGNPRALSLIHATRIFVIVTITPMIMVWGFGATLDRPIGVSAAVLPWQELGLMMLAAILGWKGGQRIGLFGATILGPMIVAAILSLAGLIHHRPPAEVILVAQFCIGIGIGASYTGVSLIELRRDVLSGVGFVIVLALLTFGFTELVVTTGLAQPVEGFLSFAPGGQAEIAILAITVGADLGFIVVHHIIRVFAVIAGAPLAANLLSLRKSITDDQSSGKG